MIGAEASRVIGDPTDSEVDGADAARGAFLPPMLYHCETPDTAARVHDTEAFGPVSTIMGYVTSITPSHWPTAAAAAW